MVIECVFPLLQSPVVYSTITPAILNQFAPQMGDYKSILLLSAITFFLLNAIKYLAAKAFSDDQAVMRAKADIYDNIIVALLIGGIWTGLQATEYIAINAYPQFITSATGPAGMLDGYIIPEVTGYMKMAHMLASTKAKIANTKVSSFFRSYTIFGIPMSMLINFFGFNEVNKLLAESELNSNISIGLSIALAAMSYIKDGAGYFLLAGFIIRSIPPFRGIGAFFICFAIGFYYIYPLTTAMFLFGIPKLSTDTGGLVELQSSFCTMKATGAIVLPQQELSSGLGLSLSAPQTVEESFGTMISTNFILSQVVALSLVALFVSNGTLILGKGLYTSVGIGDMLRKIV